MKKALMVATVARFFGLFEQNDIKLLQELGYEVHCAADLSEDIERTKNIEMVRHHIDFNRSPFSKQTIVAYRQLKKLMEEEHFDLIHCHTPVGGVCARLAARSFRKSGTKVIYTAHGFHFFRGAPLRNWLLYYPVEKLCSRWTDVLITINKEDYALAQKKMKAKKVAYIPGVGIDLKKFNSGLIDRDEKRKELGLKPGDKMLLSVGELNKNKNHETVIRAVADMDDVNYIVAGEGERYNYLQKIIDEYAIADRVKLLGYRSDIKELLEVADIFIFSSFREGLPVSIMEAMASGLPVVCSRIRGNVDLIDENGGMFFDPYSINDCKDKIETMFTFDLKELGRYNTKKTRNFSLELVREQMKLMYEGKEQN